ncbi:toxin-antitoxin system YwqK family antitoxin [Hanstruepera flava]|uniref:toxin-antitoxin system YwqK family antitoxin n=1 Tax=Hanstruepera flava TaxID=2930218 RepID=UPI002028264C|nr:toxin-antitoxin system YwqK family antitoxin [Hanstruepera flava]
MKSIVSILIVLIAGLASAQEFNQFDANGKRHGNWKKNFDGTQVLRYEGKFNHGQEVGQFKFYKNINGKAVLTATRDFNTDGTAKVMFYASNGKVVSEGLMKGRTYIGPWKYYHNNSDQLMTLEHYNSSGELDGDRIIYYPNGQIAEKTFYKSGKLDGKANWYAENGVLIKEYLYDNGQLNGKASFYDKAGKLMVEGVYRNDKKHGIWKYYENGELKEEKDFTVYSKNPYKKKKN